MATFKLIYKQSNPGSENSHQQEIIRADAYRYLGVADPDNQSQFETELYFYNGAFPGTAVARFFIDNINGVITQDEPNGARQIKIENMTGFYADQNSFEFFADGVQFVPLGDPENITGTAELLVFNGAFPAAYTEKARFVAEQVFGYRIF